MFTQSSPTGFIENSLFIDQNRLACLEVGPHEFLSEWNGMEWIGVGWGSNQDHYRSPLTFLCKFCVGMEKVESWVDYRLQVSKICEVEGRN